VKNATSVEIMSLREYILPIQCSFTIKDDVLKANQERFLYLVHSYNAVFGEHCSHSVFADSGILLRLHDLTYPVAIAWSSMMVLLEVSNAARNKCRKAYNSGIIGS
jgi:hypothetical protein